MAVLLHILIVHELLAVAYLLHTTKVHGLGDSVVGFLLRASNVDGRLGGGFSSFIHQTYKRVSVVTYLLQTSNIHGNSLVAPLLRTSNVHMTNNASCPHLARLKRVILF